MSGQSLRWWNDEALGLLATHRRVNPDQTAQIWISAVYISFYMLCCAWPHFQRTAWNQDNINTHTISVFFIYFSTSKKLSVCLSVSICVCVSITFLSLNSVHLLLLILPSGKFFLNFCRIWPGSILSRSRSATVPSNWCVCSTVCITRSPAFTCSQTALIIL